MNMKFCFLEKDKKTFQILQIYFDDFKKNKSLFNEDNQLQICEILEHNKINNCNNPEEWINKHGGKYRNYLNAIKIVAVIFICSGINLNKGNFDLIIDQYNKCEGFFLETIF